MAKGLDSEVRQFEAPFQLWDDLRCPPLKYYPPIDEAAHEVRYKRAQKRDGVIPLLECQLVP